MKKPCGLRMCPRLGGSQTLRHPDIVPNNVLGTDLGQRAEEPGGRGTLA